MKRARSKDMVDLLRERLKLGLQIGCNRGHQVVESPSPIGFLEPIDPNPQRIFDIVDLDENVFGNRNAVTL